MSQEPTGTESRIREGLERRAERAGLVPSSLGEVQRRARGIRRRRTSWAVGGSAAAVVVLAGVGVALGPGLDHDGAPGPATTVPTPLHVTPSASAPSPTSQSSATSPSAPPPSSAVDPSTPASTGPRSYVVDTRKVVEGNGPSLLIPTWMKGTLADGRGDHAVAIEEQPRWPVLDARTGRWHAMVTDPSTGEIRWNTYAADGSVASYEEAASDSVAVTPDGSTYAVVLKDAGIGVRLRVAGAQQWEAALGSGDGWAVAGILPDGKVVVSDAQGRTVLVSRDGTQRTVPGSTPQAVDPVTGQIAVRTKDGGPASCWGLVGEGGSRGPETCDDVPFRFSADGSEVAAFDAAADNVGEGVATVRLLDGRSLTPLATFTAAKGQWIDVQDAAWMGDRLVVPVRGPVDGTDSWEIALLSTDGATLIHASASPARGSTAPPYSFGAGPLDAG